MARTIPEDMLKWCGYPIPNEYKQELFNLFQQKADGLIDTHGEDRLDEIWDRMMEKRAWEERVHDCDECDWAPGLHGDYGAWMLTMHKEEHHPKKKEAEMGDRPNGHYPNKDGKCTRCGDIKHATLGFINSCRRKVHKGDIDSIALYSPYRDMPEKYMKDCSERLTLGDLVRNIGDMVDRQATSAEICDYLDEMFFWGAWKHVVELMPANGHTFLNDLRGLFLNLYKEGLKRGEARAQKLTIVKPKRTDFINQYPDKE
jgi:hypothetical protein